MTLEMVNFEEIAEIAGKKAGDLQPWPNYYKLRAKEMEALFSLYRPASCGRALDIGSGMAFNALMLDRLYSDTVAADLYAPDLHTHSLGMSVARSFLDKVPHKNIELVSARCENLPFRDNSFDTVFMIYVLEHIKDRSAALKEVRRVIKPGGEAVLLVPGFFERLLYPASFYKEIIVKSFRYFFGRRKTSAGGPESAEAEASGKEAVAKRFFSAYRHFPFPDPHGEYPDYFCELAGSVSALWYGLAKISGLKVKKSFTTMVFPKEFSSIFLGEKALEYYIKTLWLNNRYGENGIVRHLGQNLCLILEKDA